MANTRYDYDVFINCPFDPGYRPMLYGKPYGVLSEGRSEVFLSDRDVTTSSALCGSTYRC